MELKGKRFISEAPERIWDALNDPGILKLCVAGCESLERVADDKFVAMLGLKIGPVTARFKGHLQLSNIRPLAGYTIHFEGQGGVAGHGKGSADVSLEAQSGGTELIYVARAQVGGKLAQLGSRLIDATAAKLSEEFFSAFERAVSTSSERADEAATVGEQSADRARGAVGRNSGADLRPAIWLAVVLAGLVAVGTLVWITS